MVQGYKTINIKEEVIYRIRDLEENRNAIEQDRFNLAGFVSRVLLEYTDKEEKEKKEILLLSEGIEELTQAVKETFDQREKNRGNITTTDINAGIRKQDLIEIENEAVERIKAIMEGLLTH